MFNGHLQTLTQATHPCAVAYDYARIRRLVRLGPGLYRFPATAYQWSGLVARLFFTETHKRHRVRYPFPALDGGCVQGAFGRAEFLCSSVD